MRLKSKTSQLYNIDWYGINGFFIANKKSKQVLEVFNSKPTEDENYEEAVKCGKANLELINS